jgi:hypothetical protein
MVERSTVMEVLVTRNHPIFPKLRASPAPKPGIQFGTSERLFGACLELRGAGRQWRFGCFD